jgi:transposase
VTAPAVAPLDVARARRLTRDLQQALTLALDLLTEVFDGQAWKVLGHDSWEAYCAAELPQLAQLRMPLEDRRAAVAELRGRGMSLRAIGAPLGLSAQTVQRDLQAADVQLATVTSLDGRTRPAAAARPVVQAPPPRTTDRVVQLLRDAGPLTVHQVAKRLRLNQCATSAALSRLAAAGRITYRRPAKRGQVGTYVL